MKYWKTLCIALVLTLLMTTPAFALEGKSSETSSEENYAIEAAAFMESVELTDSAKQILEAQLSDEAMAFLEENNVAFNQSNSKTMNGVQKLCDEVPGLYGLNEDILSLRVYIEFSKI